jgi:hypothetical protein
MAFQKNFVVKNGLEVNDNLIFADKSKNTVGVGTTTTPEKLQVNGGIGATSLVLSGVGTIPTLKSTDALVSNGYINVGVVTSITGTGLTYTTGNFGIVNASNVNAVSGVVTNLSGTISTFSNTYTSVLNSGTVLTPNLYAVSGVVTTISGSSLSYTNITGSSLNVSGVSTVGSLSIGSTQVISSSRELQNISSLDATTTATIEAAIANAPNTFTDLKVTGISTLGTVRISSGIVTATSGIVTYYGDGRYLNLSSNAATGIGIGTTGGVVGYGITFLSLKGAGVSTTQYNSSAGIATIFFEGGGGSGTIGIGTSFPSSLEANNGDLFFNINYGRTFVYYDEVVLGVGSSAFWIDAAPFNQGLNASLAGVAFSTGSASTPSAYFEGYSTTGWFSPAPGQFGVVSVGNTILTVNPNGVNITGVATASRIFTNNGIIVSGIATATGFAGTYSGNLAVFSGNSTDNIVRITQTGSGNALLVEDDANPDTTPFVITGIGSVGIGTNAPVNTLDVHGTIKLGRQDSALDGGEIVFARSTDNANAWALDVYGSTSTPSFRITDVSQSATRLNISPAGNIGLGSTGTSRLHVFGDAIVTGVVTATDFNSTSDLNLKENITTVDNALNLVNDLRGVRFEWKKDHKPSYGVIAQELEEVLPELVTNTDPKTVNYNGIIGVLIEAVKELSVEIEELKAKIADK